MSVTQKLLIAGAVSAISFGVSSARAQADAAPDREGASAGVLLGYGFDSAYKFGLGARGGYTLAQKIYIGGTFVYHFGQSESVGGFTASESLFYVGPEAGYDFAIPGAPQVLVRPYLGLGFESVHVSESGVTTVGGVIINPGGSASSSGFSLWPGVTGLYSFTPNLSAGLDARVVAATFSGGDATFALFLTGQYKF
jgi:hypothetical protein